MLTIYVKYVVTEHGLDREKDLRRYIQCLLDHQAALFAATPVEGWVPVPIHIPVSEAMAVTAMVRCGDMYAGLDVVESVVTVAHGMITQGRLPAMAG